MKLLVIGGYGAFGGRLATLLSDLPVEICIGGRTLKKAQSFCETQDGQATYSPVLCERNDLADILARLQPDIVVDASGPFQLYGDEPYTVVKACLEYGCHYLDLADAAEFVAGISQFDQKAKDKGLFLLSGLSTCPALSGAVLRDIEKDMDITDVEIGIAPTPYAGLGKSVIEAALAYAGGDIGLKRGGQVHTAKGLTEYRRYTITPPGTMPLRNRHFSLAELPDFTLAPKAHPNLRSIWGGAGIRPEWLHKGLNILAHARALFKLPAFNKLAGLAQWALNIFKSGDHRGGMYVHVKGHRDGRATHKSWHLIAEGDDGPIIPAKACEAIIRKIHAGQSPKIGARPANEELDLSDFDAVFKRHQITHGTKIHNIKRPAFRHVIGSVFETLPETVKHLHGGKSGIWEGEAEVKGPSNILGQIAALLAGIRIKSGNVPVTFNLICDGTTETWERDFGGRAFKSRLTPGTGKNKYLMMERFGFISIAMALVIKDEKLYFVPRRWFAFGIPLPNLLIPKGETYETEQNGVFQFNVKLDAPFIGRIAHYKGWLAPA